MRRRVMVLGGVGLGVTVAAAFGGSRWMRRAPPLPPTLAPMEIGAFDALAAPLPPPGGPLDVFHLGHSLVGRDMPAFLAQLGGHAHASQLGWGTPLRAHWEDRIEIAGFHEENAHDAFLPAREALASGAFGAMVLTEMVEIRDAIRWHGSAHYLAAWARQARLANPGVRVFLYETWHRLDDAEGWLERIDADLSRYWVDALLRGAAAEGAGGPIHLIPGGQALARVARAAEAGQIPGLHGREGLFARTPEAEVDKIHLNDLGHYLVALVHYATIYQRSPEGLPARLLRADGMPVDFGETGQALQPVIWQAVKEAPYTGITA